MRQKFFDDVCEHCGSAVEGMTVTEEEGFIERAEVVYYAKLEPIVCYYMLGDYKAIREDKIIEEVM